MTTRLSFFSSNSGLLCLMIISGVIVGNHLTTTLYLLALHLRGFDALEFHSFPPYLPLDVLAGCLGVIFMVTARILYRRGVISWIHVIAVLSSGIVLFVIRG